MLDERSDSQKSFSCFQRLHTPLLSFDWQKRGTRVFAGLALSACFEFLRIRGRLDISLIRKYMRSQGLRVREAHRKLFYLLAIPVTILLFQESAAIASSFIIAITDPLCSLAGLKWGRTKIFGKSLEGSSVFFALSLLILSFFPFSIHVCLITAFIVTLIELFTPRWLDDNLTIPIGTAIVLTLLT